MSYTENDLKKVWIRVYASALGKPHYQTNDAFKDAKQAVEDFKMTFGNSSSNDKS
jgi:hypothetical protein